MSNYRERKSQRLWTCDLMKLSPPIAPQIAVKPEEETHLKKRHIGLFGANLANTIRGRAKQPRRFQKQVPHSSRLYHRGKFSSASTVLLSGILRTPTLSSTRHHYILTVNQDSSSSLWTGRWTTTSPRTFEGSNNRPRYRYLLTPLQAGRCPVNLTIVKTLMLKSLRNLYLF